MIVEVQLILQQKNVPLLPVRNRGRSLVINKIIETEGKRDVHQILASMQGLYLSHSMSA